MIKKGSFLAIIVLACHLGSAQAQSLVMRDIGGGFQGAASLDLAQVRTDNYFFQPKNPAAAIPGTPVSTEIAATGYSIRPNLLIDRDAGAARLKFRAAGEYSDYDLDLPGSYETENFDGLVSSGLEWTLGTRNRMELGAEFRRGHDALGSTATALTNSESDKWNQTNLTGQYRLGAREAAFNIEFSGGSRNRTYVSNEATTQFLDFQTDSVGSALYYNYSPKSALVLDLTYRQTAFDRVDTGVPVRDSSEIFYRAGVQWKATAKTTGDLRVGYLQKDFDSVRGDINKLTWLGSLTWTPASRTTFSLFTSQINQESYLVTTANNALTIDNTDVGIEWSQRWGTRLTTYASSRFLNSEFIGAPLPGSSTLTTIREDDVKVLSLAIEYNLMRYVSLLASISQGDRNSTFAASEYENTISHIGIRLIP